MAIEITMPKLSLTMQEGTIACWHKREGESVQEKEVLFEVMTDKVNMEVEAPASGTLLRILHAEGEAVPVGGTLAIIGQAGEGVGAADPEVGKAGESTGQTGERAGQAGERVHRAAQQVGEVGGSIGQAAESVGGWWRMSPRARRLARERGLEVEESSACVQGTGSEGRIVARDVFRVLEESRRDRPRPTPLTARIAEEARIDLSTVAPSGPGGRILKDDVLSASKEREGAWPAVGGGMPRLESASTGPLVGMRKIIATRMMQSQKSTAHVTLNTEVDVTESARLREQLVPEWEKQGLHLTYTDIVVKAVSKALVDNPRLNSTLVDGQVTAHSRINVGVAVALEEGLIVPVIREADKRSLAETTRARADLVEKARSGGLSQEEVTGGTFTVTNLGAYGIDAFTPIINAPEVAILGVGRIVVKPVVLHGEIKARSMISLSLTFDHQVVDGAPAAKFLQRVSEILERPYLLLT